jgi:hypothetical protein
MDFGTKSTTTRSKSTFCITCLWNRSRKNIQCCLMDCIMSCVTFFTFHFPTNSSHGSKDWWWASIFAFIACTWAQCLHFFQHLSVTSPQFFIALVSVVHLWLYWCRPFFWICLLFSYLFCMDRPHFAWNSCALTCIQHIPTIELQISKKRIDDWFIIQHPVIITLTISKIGNPHMSQ